MSSKKQMVQEAVLKVASPIIEEMGLELVDVELTHHGRDQVLRLYLDRDGGITVDELQEASRAVETVLEVDEVVRGAYRLEVSSPGLDRPLKRRSDYEKNLGSRVKVKTFTPLPDGSRTFAATLVGLREEDALFEKDDGGRLAVPLDNISSARPDIDWTELLKGRGAAAAGQSRARRNT